MVPDPTAQSRKYSPTQRQFLKEFNEKRVQCSWVYRNLNSRWACPALPVRKPGTEAEWRQTIDFRPVNALTVALAGAMPIMSTMLPNAKAKKHRLRVS